QMQIVVQVLDAAIELSLLTGLLGQVEQNARMALHLIPMDEKHTGSQDESGNQGRDQQFDIESFVHEMLSSVTRALTEDQRDATRDAWKGRGMNLSCPNQRT